MRNVLCFALLVPVLALAAGTTQPGTAVKSGVSLQPMTALPGDGQAGPASPPSGSGPTHAARFTVGIVDTVGGTTYDWCSNGPAFRALTQTPGKGVHAIWMYSTDMSNTNFPDRNIRYNFYDYGTGTWNWIDADFMQSGVNIYAERAGYGTIDVDTNGVAVILAHHATTAGYAPVIARDADAGAGIFEYAPGEPTLDRNVWCWLGINMNGYYQLAMIDDVSQDNLQWSRSTAWQSYDVAMSIPSPQPEPLFPAHGIATSKVSGTNKVSITWVATSASYMQEPGFYRESQDGGTTWDAPVDLGFPPAFSPGSETVPSYHLSSLFPWYDMNNNLHIVGSVGPYVRDTNWILPAEIWHWCPANPDTWNLIRVASPDSFNASAGYNAMVASRPSIGADGAGNLFVAWEEFDGVNVEQTTSRLRADIWYSSSTDNGVTWDEGTKLTDGGNVSYRFPSILNPIGDTIMVTYIVDQTAGFFVQGEGPATNNPIVVQKFVSSGIEGPKVVPPGRMAVAASPSPANDRTAISYSVPRSGDVSLVIYDAAGRPVKTLASGHREAGRYTAMWDAGEAAAGVYFYTLTSGKAAVTRKLILAD